MADRAKPYDPRPRPSARPPRSGAEEALQRRWPTLSLPDYASLVTRVGMATILVILYALGFLRGSTATPAVFLTGLAIMVAAAVFDAAALLGAHMQPRRVLRLLLAPDLVSSALVIWATGAYQDPLYPWMIGLAMIYGAGLAFSESVGFASLVATAYLVGHIVGHVTMHTGDDIVLIVFKSIAIVVTAVLVGDVSRRQAQREWQLRQSQRQYHDLNEKLSRRLSELRAISEITEIVHSTLDFEQVGHLVLEIVSKVIDLPASALFVIDKRRDETLYSASFGITPDVTRRTPDSYGPATQVPGEEMFACTTVLDRGHLMVVFCASGERLERLGSEDRLVLSAVANDLTIAVENSELYKLTKKLAITDELTSLFNYRFMLQRLEDEIERARRFGRSLSLLMLDADDFKVYNDTHGHIAGDEALSELAAVMHAAVRDIDVVCRYGGEEFAILLPETDAEGAFVTAEKVREAVASHAFPDGRGEKTQRITVSIGLSTFPRPADDREALLRQADDALYAAKRSGRNRVSASRGPSTGMAADPAPAGPATAAGER
jgi:diguanylate cyclase (GGDEF)-like protein